MHAFLFLLAAASAKGTRMLRKKEGESVFRFHRQISIDLDADKLSVHVNHHCNHAVTKGEKVGGLQSSTECKGRSKVRDAVAPRVQLRSARYYASMCAGVDQRCSHSALKNLPIGAGEVCGAGKSCRVFAT